MFLARVTGHVIATQKVGSMVGHKLLIVEPFRVKQPERDGLQTTGRSFVAVDTLGAGVGEFVLITQGSSARLTPETRDLPIDTVIVGIVDRVHVGSAMVYGRTSDGPETTQSSETPSNEST